MSYEEDKSVQDILDPPMATEKPDENTVEEEDTLKIAPPPAAADQTSPGEYVPAREQVSVEQEPSVLIAPPVPAYDSGSQWPQSFSQHQVADGSFHQTPPPPASQPFVPAPEQQTSASGSQSQPLSRELKNVMSALKLLLQPFPGDEKIAIAMRSLKRLLVVLMVACVLLAGGNGIAIYQLTRPQPIVTVTSRYMTGTTLAGSTGTSLHVLGYRFSSNSPITFILDNNLAPGQPLIHSNAEGNFEADLPITSDWPVGTHRLTARDDGSNLPKNGIDVAVVHQGEAHTPGPDGAPPDDASFTLKVTINYVGSLSGSFTKVLAVKSQDGRDSGTVCDPNYETNRPLTSNGSLSNGTTYKTSTIYSCLGTYKGGKLSYTETVTNSKADYSNGSSCQSVYPFVLMQLNGTFSSATTISGTYARPGGTPITCTQGGVTTTSHGAPLLGTWTGSI